MTALQIYTGHDNNIAGPVYVQYLSILSCFVNAIYIYQLPTDKTVLFRVFDLQTFGPFCYSYWYLERCDIKVFPDNLCYLMLCYVLLSLIPCALYIYTNWWRKSRDILLVTILHVMARQRVRAW